MSSELAQEGRSLHSAGGVVYRRRDDGTIEVCLIQPRRDRWALPKGMIEHGETSEQAALREVREETGLEATITAPLGSLTYFFFAGGKRVRKTVDFYLMRFLSGSTDDHDHEVLSAAWFAVVDAERLLAYPNERRVLADARAQIGLELRQAG